MNFSELIKKRNSIRQFKKQEVEKDKIKKILEAANWAPSAGNLQAYQIFVIKKQVQKDQMALACFGQNFIARSSVVLVFVTDPARSGSRYANRGEKLYCLQDATIACAYAQLKARDLGLGSCWVGAFDEEAVREITGAPSDSTPVSVLPLGYSSVSGERSDRRSLSDLVTEI